MEVAGLRLSVIEGKLSWRAGLCLEEAALELHLWYTLLCMQGTFFVLHMCCQYKLLAPPVITAVMPLGPLLATLAYPMGLSPCSCLS